MWLLDNTFMGNWADLPSPKLELVVRAIRECPVRLSWETIRESLNVTPAHLPLRASLLAACAAEPPFREAGQIVLSELRGEPEPYWPDEAHESFRRGMLGLANGHEPGRDVRNLRATLATTKNESKEKYSALKKLLTSRESLKPPWDGEVPFDEFCSTYWRIHNEAVTRHLRGVDPEIRHSVADVLGSPKVFPFTYAWLRAEPALMYRHAAAGRKVDTGDFYDTLRMVYLAEAEGIVTDDRGLHHLVSVMWGQDRRAVTTVQFIAEMEGRLTE